MVRGRERIDPDTGEVLAPGEYPTGPQTLFVISPFTEQTKGRSRGVVKAQDILVKTEPEARNRAEAMVASGRYVGAIVIRQTSDPDTGEYAEPEALARLGRIPEDL